MNDLAINYIPWLKQMDMLCRGGDYASAATTYSRRKSQFVVRYFPIREIA